MKGFSRTIRYQTAMCVLWILLCFLFLSGCRSVAYAQEPTPPAPQQPQEPATSLQLPTPVIAEPIEGNATLPETLPLGFAVDIAGIVLGGDWDIKGRVLAFEEGTVTFATDNEETGHLVYRLPDEIRLSPINSGQPIFIQRTLRGNDSSLGYQLQVTSSDKLLIASGSISGSEAQTIDLSPRISLQQVPEQRTLISESKYEIIYQVQVLLNLDGTVMEVIVGQSTEFLIDGKNYLLLVTQSSEIRPTKEYEGVAEGSGYALEYVLTLK